jgi:hypothetical protein
VAVVPEEFPEFVRHSECNMLPFSIRESVKAVFNPIVCGFFTAGRTKSGFAGMGCSDGYPAETNKDMISEESCTTDKEF